MSCNLQIGVQQGHIMLYTKITIKPLSLYLPRHLLSFFFFIS